MPNDTSNSDSNRPPNTPPNTTPNTPTLDVSARFDVGRLSAGRPSRVGLLLEVAAPRPSAEDRNRAEQRPDLNIALVIDRSGSMADGRLLAAARAARGIAEALGPRDRLSLVSFNQAVDRHFEALAMDEAGKALAYRAIDSLRPSGLTDLGAGWHEGARCAALALAEETHRSGHVIVLSDGRANRGITDPQELARHAGELALRGIKTSAVGIGDGYSPLQLDALAEAGQGRLHDADTPEDIVDVVLGELGELREVVAESLELTLAHPSILQAQVLTRVRAEQDEKTVIVPMGALRGGRTRTVALMFDVPALAADTHLDFSASLRWHDALTGEERRQQVPLLALGIVHPISAEAADRDLEVVRTITDFWEASLAYQAASVNERGDLGRAGALLAEVESAYWDWISALEDAEHRRSRFAQMRAAASRVWRGRSKREPLTKAKKAMRGERDLRVRDTGEWHDYLGRR